MITYLKRIKLLSSNVGYFPQLYKYLNHGFSWGKKAGNMQFSMGDVVNVRKNVQRFLNKLDMGNIKDTINLIEEHKDRIVDVDQELYDSLSAHRFGRAVKGDAIFTKLQNVTLTTKPGDCTTAVTYGKTESDDEVVGIIHTGRKGVDVELAKKSIRHLVKRYGCKANKIYIGIIPHLSKENRKFEHLTDFQNLKAWDGFIEERDGFYCLAETECVIDQYISAGVKEENMFVYDVDTYEAASKGEIFSYKYHLEMEKKGKKVPEGRFIVGVRRKN